MGGNADTLLGLGAAVAFALPKGVGALADMGGNAAAVIVFGVADFTPSKGFGALADLGGNADTPNPFFSDLTLFLDYIYINTSIFT